MSTPHELGSLGESIACEYLANHGYQIVTRNYHAPRGEIDIVSKFGEMWVFCEVKLRTSNTAGEPEESITGHKVERIKATAIQYLAERVDDVDDQEVRIDAISIHFTKDGKVFSIAHQQGMGQLDE